MVVAHGRDRTQLTDSNLRGVDRARLMNYLLKYSIYRLFGIFAMRIQWTMAKVIHVFLVKPIDGEKRRDWYFSSISAIYTVLTPEQVGASKNYLLHAGLSGNGTVVTKTAIIKQSTLIGCHRKGAGEDCSE